jgi:hypothetical protein
MIAVTFVFSAVGTQTWVVPADGSLMSFVGQNCGVSWDPAAVAADFNAPPATKQIRSLLCFNTANSQYEFGDGFELKKDELLFVFSKVAGTSQLYFQLDV